MTNNEIIEQMRLERKRSAPYLQRKLKISFDEAKQICDGLVFDKKENIYLNRVDIYLNRMKDYLRKL